MLAEMTRDPAAPPTATQAASADAHLQAANRAHEAGRLDEAKARYLDALALNPHKPEAEHGLAWLLVQQGDWKAALPRFAKALKLRPWEKEFWISQLEALMQVGQHEAVHRLLHRAAQAGLAAAQLDVFERRLREHRTALLAERVRASGKTARQAADAPQAALMAVRDAFLKRDFAGARERAAAVIRSHPLCAFAWRVLGASMPANDGSDAAVEVLRIALDLDPENVDVIMNLALALNERGRLDEASGLFAAVLARQPDNVRALVNQGLVLNARRDPQAETLLRRARELGAGDHRVALALGAYLRDRDQHAEALPLLEEALRHDPNNQAVLAAMCICLLGVGRHADADALFRRIDTGDTAHLGALGIALFVGAHLESVSPEDLFDIHRRYGRVLEASVVPFAHHENDRDPERRLRVGFVSGDLFNHAVAYFVRPLWRNIDPAAIDVFAYATRPAVDDTAAGLKELVPQWRDASGWDDERLAAAVRQDGIDILVDMSGHTAANRLGAFARGPAPVQVSWLGYPATTGLERIHYYLADTTYTSTGDLSAQFTENLLLSEVGCGFDPAPDLPPIAPLPALAAGRFTFGSFNRVSKLTPGTLRLWADVLARVPASDLLLGAAAPEDERRLRDALGALGVAGARLRFLPRLAPREYLEAHAAIDLLLDAYPYGGGTTTCHGLWMGVPTLTLAGPTLASRSGLSVVGRAGLPEFVARDAEDFVAKAARWSGDVAGLAAVRATLRDRLAEGALGDPALVGRAFEAAMRQIWRRWCAGLPPAQMVVPRPVALEDASR